MLGDLKSYFFLNFWKCRLIEWICWIEGDNENIKGKKPLKRGLGVGWGSFQSKKRGEMIGVNSKRIERDWVIP